MVTVVSLPPASSLPLTRFSVWLIAVLAMEVASLISMMAQSSALFFVAFSTLPISPLVQQQQLVYTIGCPTTVPVALKLILPAFTTCAHPIATSFLASAVLARQPSVPKLDRWSLLKNS